MDDKTIILASIFIMLMVIIFKAIDSMLALNKTSSFILSVCVSVLSIMGIARSIDTILLLYAALAATILLLPLLAVIVRYFKRSNNRLSERDRKKNISKNHDKRSKR